MNKRLLLRADDIGYTLAFDTGAFKAIDHGYVTAADVMLDSPHTVEALKWLKQRPWISIGWHAHLWESPVLPASEVPTLVDAEGRFKWRHNHNELRAEASYEDTYKELCAEMDRCIAVYGKAPSTTSFYREDGTAFSAAMKDVIEKYGIDTDFWKTKVINTKQIIGWYKRKDEGLAYRTLEGKQDEFSLERFKTYDPIVKILNATWPSEDTVLTAGGHPGYLDDHILAESSCTLHRVKELEYLTDPRVGEFIIRNKIELVNTWDVMYGTSSYQDHLKEIGSPLWVGNFDKD